MNTMVKMVFGSRLYGTNTEKSDTDFKGVFFPSHKDLLLQRVPKSLHKTTKLDQHAKSGADDVEEEMYSLNYFIDLACAGETVALDMLHAPVHALTESSLEWEDLVSKRHLFYTKNLKAFVGYARKQAAKYGVKGSRLSDAERVLAFFKERCGPARVEDRWDDLPTGEHIHKLENVNGRLYEVCGKKINPKASFENYVPMLEKFVQNYGDRARQAQMNEGVDWKAMSHALRAGFQVRHVLQSGGYEYPLPETPLLKEVKSGALPFLTVATRLDNLLDELEELSASSTLPEKVDREYWDVWLVNVLKVRLYLPNV